jgi:DNA mismatch repair protein MutS2
MAFDNHLMQPLFQLFIGKPGSSFAFEIAKKIGLPDNVLAAASERAGVKNVNYDRHLKDIARDKRYWESKRQSIRQQEKRLEELIEGYEKELAEARSVRKEIISSAKNEAKALLDNSNRLIENTIRQIKESQAEKEKTAGIRQQIEEFKSTVSERSEEPLTDSERKADRLKQKAVRLRPGVKKKTAAPEAKDMPVKAGDAVRMTDTLAAGEIVKIEGDMAQVEMGNLRLFIPLDKIEKISRSELKKSIRKSTPGMQVSEELNQRKLKFKPEIDIRGVRGEEALMAVRDFLDTALMLQHRNLRILHGKGNGILRELVRNYLASSGVVKTFSDEHVELGGSGITVVELDI